MPADVMTWGIPVAMLLIAVLSPILAWWGSTRYFVGVMTAQYEAAQAWRQSAEKRLSDIDDTLRANSYPTVLVRIGRLEQDVVDIRGWKHVKVDPYCGAVDVLKSRIDTFEDRFGESLEGITTRIDALDDKLTGRFQR